MNKNTLQKLFLFCLVLMSAGSMLAQPVVFTGALPDANITVECDAIPAAAVLTAEGCLAPAPFAFFNEIHYDNASGDVGEFIEVVGSAGFDLSNCTIELYNGPNLYNTTSLAGIIDDEGMGFGAVSFSYPVNGIQNGGSDGFALVCNGTVVEFLSYEGTITANNGSAAGMTSTDLGVSETSATPIGQSLQRINLFFDNPGCAIADFQWAGPSAESPGSLNTGQSFQILDCAGSTDAIVSLAEVITPGACAGEFTIVRTYTATDGCGETAEFVQTITAEDNTEPVFIDPPADLTLNCGDPIPAATDVFASDNCFSGAAPAVWINEIHYDNTSGDINEFVEIAGTGGFDLTGYTLVVYNGNGGAPYGTMNLTGVLGNEGSGFGAIAFPYPVNGLQNGAPDGIALVDAAGVVIQFLSYEGSFTGNGGPADGMISMDIGVMEPGAIGESLQLVGTGAAAADFAWTGPVAESPGLINIDQNFGTILADFEEVLPVNGACGNIIRIYTADDGCGNMATHVQTISISDAVPPVVVCPPSQTLSCFETAPTAINNAADFIAAGGVITDNCTADLDDFTVFSQTSSNGGDNCPGNATVLTRTYFVTDLCGNVATCDQTITYLASAAGNGPVVTSILPTCFKYCASLANPMESDITFDTDCSFGASVNITGPTQIGADNCPGSIYRYTYTVTDDCGRVSAPVVRDFIIQNDAPTIEVPAFNLILECNDPNNQDYVDAHLGLVTANSSCGLGLVVNNNFSSNFNFTACGSSTVVTFTAIDNCGRTATATTIIAVQDNEAPTFTNIPPSICDVTECGGDVNYWYNHWIDYMLTGLQAEDQCDNNVSITASNTPLNMTCDASGNAVTTVTFSATDNCANTSTYVGTFTIENTNPSSFVNVPADASVECGDPIAFGPAPTVVNGCNTSVAMATVVDNSDPCNVLHTRTWTATDACGGFTTTAAQTITESDNTDPVITGGADLTVECTEDILTAGLAWAATNAGATATDACTSVTWTNNILTAQPVLTPDCAAGALSYADITFTATDDCGNASSVTYRISVVDTTAPTFTTVPTGGTVECAADMMIADPTAADACSAVVITSTDDMVGDDCSGSLTRIWTATDACGNTATASATFNYIDTQAPTTSSVPVDMTISCTETIVFDADPVWSDNCDTDVFSSFEDTTTPGDCEGSYTERRDWSAIDACGNLAVVSQTITVVDDVAPVFTSVPADSEEACGNAGDFGDAEASDACSSVVITFDDVANGMGCAGSVTRTWTATDDCGNTATASATITLNDDEAPVFTFIPAVADLDCDDDLTPEAPQASDNCGAVTVEMTNEDVNGELCDNGYAIHYTWTATDACGNTATASTSIWIDPDNEAPVFTFVPAGDYGDCANFPPVFGEPVVEDACGSVSLTFIDEAVGNINGCDENENFDYRRVWTATDACGNTSTAKQTFWILVQGPSSLTVGGVITTEEGDAVEDVEVTLTGGANFSQMYPTENDGLYNFVDLELGSNYQVDPYFNQNPMNGVSTYDLVLISKHVLSVQTLDSPYKMIAADINRSGSITTFDMVELRKMILFINTEFTNNDSWRFVDANFVFPYADNPFATAFPELVDINGLLASEIHDFVGVKIGDVNGTAVANNLMGVDDRTFNGNLNFKLDNPAMEAGSTYEVVFRASDFEEVAGYQYSIAFDADQMEFVSVEAGSLEGLSEANFGLTMLNEGIITTSWNSNDAVTMRNGEELFTLTFKAKSDTQLSEVINVSSRYTKAEAYNANLDLMSVQFRFEGATTAADFSLQQNRPNPFKQSTVIGFSLPTAANATLTFYDVSGKELKQINGDFVKGYNEVSLNRNELQTNGLVYYELVTPSHTATKRMLLTNN